MYNINKFQYIVSFLIIEYYVQRSTVDFNINNTDNRSLYYFFCSYSRIATLFFVPDESQQSVCAHAAVWEFGTCSRTLLFSITHESELCCVHTASFKTNVIFRIHISDRIPTYTRINTVYRVRAYRQPWIIYVDDETKKNENRMPRGRFRPRRNVQYNNNVQYTCILWFLLSLFYFVFRRKMIVYNHNIQHPAAGR